MDSALVQLEVIRDENGQINLGELKIIPVSISSMKGQNNFQPMLYTEGSEEYKRTMSKLDGSFTGPDLTVNYDHLKPTDPPATEPPAGEEPPAGTDAPTPPPATDAPAPPPATDAPAPPPADEGSDPA
jgi:hypothetical protein